MVLYTINQYQTFDFSYVSGTAGLHIDTLPDNIGFYNNFDGTYTFGVDVAGAPSVIVYDVLNALDVVVDQIQLTIAAKAVDETHALCLSQINQLFPLPAPPSGSWVISNTYYPDFIILLPFGNGIVAVSIAGKTGDIYLMFQTTTNPLTETYLMKIEIQPCLPSYNFCTPYRVPIIWKNPAGGWSSYCFKGKKTFGVSIGNSKQYKNSNRVQRHYSRSDIYDTWSVLSGELPVGHAAFLKSLKYSIQAYILTTIGYLPILIDEKEFILYEEGNGLMTYDVPLKLSTEIPIQTW